MRTHKRHSTRRYPKADTVALHKTAIELMHATSTPGSISYSQFSHLMASLQHAERKELMQHTPEDGNCLISEVISCYRIRANQDLSMENDFPLLKTEKGKLLHIIKNMHDNGARFERHDDLKLIPKTAYNTAVYALLSVNASLLDALKLEKAAIEKRKTQAIKKSLGKKLETELTTLLEQAIEHGAVLDPMQVGRIAYLLKRLEHKATSASLFTGSKRFDRK